MKICHEIFPFKTIPKHPDPYYKTDLVFFFFFFFFLRGGGGGGGDSLKWKLRLNLEEIRSILNETANTVELQWLEHLWNHENMFKTGVVRANECLSERKVRRPNRDIYSICFNMKEYCVFLLESPHQGDSN